MELEATATVLGMSFIDYGIQVRAWKRNSILPQDYDDTYKDEITVITPAFGNPSYLSGIKPLGVKTVVVTTDHESPAFEAVLATLNVDILRAPIVKPHSYNLLQYGVTHVQTPYVLFLDADTEVGDDATKIPSMLVKNELELASFLVLPRNPRTLAERLQHFEYVLSMNARKVYPWLTSGAAIAGNTEVLRRLLSNHSLFFSGGDIEIGKIAMLRGHRVGHLTFRMYTQAPDTFRKLARQRYTWAGGSFRHAIVNIFVYSWRAPYFFCYSVVVLYFLAPLRWYEIIYHFEILPIIYGVHCVYLLIIFKKAWRPTLLVSPLYALINATLLLPVGLVSYIQMARKQRNWGFINHKRGGV
jgi:cellulose synthase/poly-beta-1,6-N-acetylglucosamine synthase-like glycosyltransferase